MIIFDFDQTLVDTSSAEHLRSSRDWKGVMSKTATFPVYEGIDQLLTDLHLNGKTLAIVTKSPDMVANWFIQQRKWPIKVVIGYHHVKRQKPDPEGLLLAIGKAGASAEVTYHVGDQAHDTEAARAAGVVSIGVAWGIDDQCELVASKPDHLFQTVGELGAFFRV